MSRQGPMFFFQFDRPKCLCCENVRRFSFFSNFGRPRNPLTTATCCFVHATQHWSNNEYAVIKKQRHLLPSVLFCFSRPGRQVLHTPGHSLGSITLLFNPPLSKAGSSTEVEGIAFTGDHLAMSGRTGALTGFPM